MNLVKKICLFLTPALVAFVPVVALAAWSPGQPLVPNCNATCGFDDLVLMGQNFITFLLWLAAPASVLLFTWAGFLWLTAGDNQGQISKAIQVFTDVVVGVLIMGAAWLLVYTALNALLSDQYKARLRLQAELPKIHSVDRFI